jgi:hypothetical protein
MIIKYVFKDQGEHLGRLVREQLHTGGYIYIIYF